MPQTGEKLGKIEIIIIVWIMEEYKEEENLC